MPVVLGGLKMKVRFLHTRTLYKDAFQVYETVGFGCARNQNVRKSERWVRAELCWLEIQIYSVGFGATKLQKGFEPGDKMFGDSYCG